MPDTPILPGPNVAAVAPATQRATRQATRRASFIQEVAKAVALLVCGPDTNRGPFAQAFHEQQTTTWQASKAYEEEAQVLRWAIGLGLLPADACELPSEALQRHLLAHHPQPT